MRSLRLGHSAPYPPRVSEDARPFWDALSNERFITTKCAECEDIAFPPKVVCPNCFSDQLSWYALSGRGTLYSYSRIWAGPEIFEADLPYTVCIVDLDEGIRVGSRLFDTHAEPEMGEPVTIVWVHYSDVTLFYFEPENK